MGKFVTLQHASVGANSPLTYNNGKHPMFQSAGPKHMIATSANEQQLQCQHPGVSCLPLLDLASM
jgi:hypothetical protein